ncbi:WecB/TagA/CpsF family glycosyltransferase [Azospirillum sp. ST 5-10]|uniref:WecB/TagA/CpsF family glycosyltransferase n=1 Tax=unclassified Azospirillum TaxID=2630922 RepID=UPI003F4A3293
MTSVTGANDIRLRELLERFGVPQRRMRFLGVPMDPLDMEETVRIIDAAIAEGVCLKHVVVNVSKLVNMRSDPALHADVVDSDLINIDGQGVVWGARLAGCPVPARVAGIDLMDRVLALCATRGYRPYILGAKQEVLERAVVNIEARYPTLEFAGYRNGYFSREDEATIVEEIRASGADCLFVAISSPTKERFTQQYRERLGVKFLMGVGGSVDVMAGMTRRAPVWMQRAGMEWFYRVLQEPRRMWKRYLVTNSLYAGLLAREVLRPRRPAGSPGADPGTA